MTRDTRIVLTAVTAVPAAMLAAAVAVTWAVAQGASMRWRLLFRPTCHGIASRCLELWGAPMPICARCLGIYAGLAATLLLVPVALRLRELVARWIAVLAVTPLAIDGLTQLAGLRESTNPLRLATGILAGLAFGVWIVAAVEGSRTSRQLP